MNFRVVSHTIGLILLVEMAFMLPSLAWCWVDGEGGVALAFAVSLALMGLAAAALLLAGRRAKGGFLPRRRSSRWAFAGWSCRCWAACPSI